MSEHLTSRRLSADVTSNFLSPFENRMRYFMSKNSSKDKGYHDTGKMIRKWHETLKEEMRLSGTEETWTYTGHRSQKWNWFSSFSQCRGQKYCVPSVQFSSVTQSCLTLCDPMELQQTRLPCPSPTPGACSNSYPLSQWCHLTISCSVIPFSSSCLWFFPASGSHIHKHTHTHTHTYTHNLQIQKNEEWT